MSTAQVVSATRSTAEYILRSVSGVGTPPQPEMFPLVGRSIAAVWPWLLIVGFRPEEVLCARICWFSSFLLQAPRAALVARALLSGHKPPCWSLTVGSVLNVSSQGSQAHGQIRLALLPIYSAGCP